MSRNTVRLATPVLIPDHWSEVRARYLFQEVDVRAGDSAVEALSVSHITGVTRRSEKNVTMTEAESYDRHKLCWPNDLAINSLWAWMGALGFNFCVPGTVSPAYHVYRMRSPNVLSPIFANYLLRTKVYAGEYLIRSNGVWSSRLLLTPSCFFDVPIILPPRDEQELIVRFLEEKERGIEHYLTIKRRMAEELNAYEASLASSRFDELSTEYSMVRLKDVCDITSGYSFESSGFVSDADGVRLVRGANVGIGRLRWTSENTVRWPEHLAPEVAHWSLRVGDLVIGLNRPWIDGGLRLAEVYPEDLPCLVLQRVARLRTRDQLLTRYLSIMLRTPRLLWELEPDFTGVGTPYINEHRMKRFRIPLPPVKKQQETIDLHAKQTEFIRHALCAVEREIAAMEEYRTRLIADAVTGQIDVRRLG